MLFALIACLLFSVLPLLWPGFFRSRWVGWSALLPLSLFTGFLLQARAIRQGNILEEVWDWVPSLHVLVHLRLDGLSLLFALLITGIGTLVFLYGSGYLKGHPALGRFYGWLSLFMGSMLGLVLSDNILSLFLFWELTSISSFFLIGFNQEDPAARRSALVALAITGGGGMALLAASLLMGTTSGLYSLSEMVSQGVHFADLPHYAWVLGLILLAAFTKSAQFPFHFWLPGAMKAPTPVSTYLHSATMVKAGVYLLFRYSPILGDHPWWTYSLLVVGGVTMVYAAWQCLFRIELKSILAYSTVASLGIMVFMIGLGTERGLKAAAVFVLAHALYKAGLFLVAGVVDHATGIRNVTLLGGLRTALPLVAVAGGIAALSNAGFPLFFGFIGKELIYEATLKGGGLAWYGLFPAVATNVLLLWAGFQVGIRPFMGKKPDGLSLHHPPDWTMWLPPLVLGGLSLLLGLWPSGIGYWIIDSMVVAGGFQPTTGPFAIWHGFNAVLLTSLITLILGYFLYRLLPPSNERARSWNRWEFLSAAYWADKKYQYLLLAAGWWTRFIQGGYLRNYVFVIIFFISSLLSYLLITRLRLDWNFRPILELTVYEVFILVIMFLGIGFTVFTKSRLVAVASLGVVGYSMCLLFVFYSAPDLAMTQFTIDTLTVILFVLVLYRLPKYLKLSEAPNRLRDGTLAIFFGGLIFLLILEVLSEPVSREVGNYYAENAYLLAKGKNVVNVILVDFRGLDTLVEISVLVIAAIGVFGLLKLRMHKSQNIGE